MLCAERYEQSYVGNEQANVSPTATAGCDRPHRHRGLDGTQMQITKAVPDHFDDVALDEISMIPMGGCGWSWMMEEEVRWRKL